MNARPLRPARPGRAALALGLALLASFASAAADAQVIRSFASRFTANEPGAVTLAGNTSMTCDGSGQCPNAQIGSGGNVNNHNQTMVYVDVDADASTFSSSQATLTVPPGATVLWAGLYWGGYAAGASRNTVKLAAPGGAYVDLTATQLDATGSAYQGFVDVTATVLAAGNGDYRVANVLSSPGGGDVWGGWAIVVVYRLLSLPTRNLTVADGFAFVGPGNPLDFNVSGFLTPPTGTVQTSVGHVSYDGDLGFQNEDFELNTTGLGDAQNPVNNVFNSTVSLLGTRFSAKVPDYINQLGFDADILSANGVLGNGSSSAAIHLRSASDRYYTGVITFTTDIFLPRFDATSFTKTVVDLNGGAVRPGDVLEYTISATNIGNDAANQSVMRDTIPSNTSYVAGSLRVASGANAGAKTDAAADDQMEYDAASRSVVARVGTGANATTGGQLGIGASTSVAFQARVSPPAPTGTTVSNQGSLACVGATMGIAVEERSDGDPATSGSQPTVSTVTASSITGRVFEDVNYGGGAGRDLAAAAGVVRSGARAELYDSTGVYLASSVTDGTGTFSFSGWSPGPYFVRVVNATVTSSRTGVVAGLLPVQTFRANASTGTALAVTDRVGGESPGKLDAASNTTNLALGALTTSGTTAQSVAPARMLLADLTGVDFGFNFSTIVNPNESGQGSLRQFLTNANALSNAGLAQQNLSAGIEHAIFMVSDGAAHAGLAAGLPNLLANGVVSVPVASALPAIGDAILLDGASQTANVGNTNAASLGAGGTVGVDAIPSPALSGPEVELRDSLSVAIGLDVQAAGVSIANLAIRGFGNAPGSNADADIRIGAAASGFALDRCVLGTSATSFADPGAAARSGGDHVRALGGDAGSVTNSLIGFGLGSGVALTAGSNGWTLRALEVRSNALGSPSRDGISVESSGSLTLRESRIASNEGCGVDTRTGSGGNTLENLTLTGNGVGSGATAETPGVRLDGSLNRVDRCVISQNYGAGVLACPGVSTTTITRNSMWANGAIAGGLGGPSSQLGIDLLAPGENEARGTSPFFTRNDVSDADAGANALLNFPVLESAVMANGSFTLSGWARPGSAIELFVADVDPSGFGEGRGYVGTFTEGSAQDLDAGSSAYSGVLNGIDQGADNTSRFRFTIVVPAGVLPGVRLTATGTLASTTSEFSGLVSVTSGVAVSGWAYDDSNHDLSRGASENGSGVVLYAKLVSSALPTSAQQVSPIDATSGAFGFGFVSAGTYSIVLDDNAVASDVAPAYPAGWIGTEAPSGVRTPLAVVAADIANQNFGLWHGSRLDGRAFQDDGAGGGVANDGVASGAEAGIAGVALEARAAACAGGVCDATTSAGSGAFTLWLPHVTAGGNVAIVEANAAGWVSTGGSAGTTGGTYSRAGDALGFTPASGVSYAAAGFGDVPPNTFLPGYVQTVFPGATAACSHVFTARSSGTLTLTSSAVSTPPIPGWSITLFRDLDINGMLDPGEPPISGPIALSSGEQAGVILLHQSPPGGMAGANQQVTLTAEFDYSNAVPALTAGTDVIDLTTIYDGGSLMLTKTVDLASALPGDLLTYTVTYSNPGPGPLSSIVLNDATPPFTVFEDATCGALGAGLSGCAITAQPAIGATGSVRWTLSGSLLPGSSGSVTFRVRVQ